MIRSIPRDSMSSSTASRAVRLPWTSLIRAIFSKGTSRIVPHLGSVSRGFKPISEQPVDLAQRYATHMAGRRAARRTLTREDESKRGVGETRETPVSIRLPTTRDPQSSRCAASTSLIGVQMNDIRSPSSPTSRSASARAWRAPSPRARETASRRSKCPPDPRLCRCVPQPARVHHDEVDPDPRATASTMRSSSIGTPVRPTPKQSTRSRASSHTSRRVALPAVVPAHRLDPPHPPLLLLQTAGRFHRARGTPTAAPRPRGPPSCSRRRPEPPARVRRPA